MSFGCRRQNSQRRGEEHQSYPDPPSRVVRARDVADIACGRGAESAYDKVDRIDYSSDATDELSAKVVSPDEVVQEHHPTDSEAEYRHRDEQDRKTSCRERV